MRTITLSPVTLSEADYVAINYQLWNRRLRTRRSNWLLGGALLLLTLGFGADLYQSAGQPTSWTTPVLLGLGLVFWVGRRYFVRWMLRRGYAQSQAVLSRPTVYTLTPTELRGQSEQGQFSNPWRAVKKAMWVAPHWLLLYRSAAGCYYLDLRCLPTTTTPADVRELLTAQQVPQQEQ